MSNLHRARRATSLFAIGLSVGLLASFGNTLAGESAAVLPNEASGYKIASAAPFEFKMASAAPFEESREEPVRRLREPFGLETSALISGDLQTKWSAVAKELPHERKILARCRTDADSCPRAAKNFLGIVDKAMKRDGLARIGELNRTINLSIRWVDDMTQYGVPDLWTTPLMTFDSEAGNCKHYATSKYVALQEMGFATDDLRLIVVRDRPTSELHAVAAVRYDGRWLILDNRTFFMVQDIDIATYNPLFVIDKEGVKRMLPVSAQPRIAEPGVSSAADGPQASSGWQSTPLLL
jgi:predicted transglutaminase-like cysteine proteinase